MKKTILANWGSGNQGKSQTLRRLIEFFERDFPNADFNYIRRDNDVTVIIAIGRIKIGIVTQGDPNTGLERFIERFIVEKCQIIVCATRSYGMTTNAVVRASERHDYNLFWITNIRNETEHQHDLLNRISAQQFLTFIRTLYEF